jgi:osmotically-inducible protein OsmY
MHKSEVEQTRGRRWSGRECWIAGSSIAAGAALGLAMMYLFDPDRGKRRRTEMLDRTGKKIRRVRRDVSGKVEDVLRRGTGAIRDATSGLGFCQESVADDILRERVRSRLGHLMDHADQVETQVRDGIVTLQGMLLSGDRSSLIRDLERIPGVRGIEDLLSAPAV